MKKGTVRRRIFVSDTAMVLATLFLFLLVNLLVLKIYSEAIEKAFLDSAEQIVNAQELEELLKQRILYQNKFLLLTAADGIACVLILIGVSFWTQEIAFFHAAHFFYADVLRGKRLKSDTGCHDWEEQEVENGSCHGISVDVLNTGAVYDDLKRHRSDREHGALDNRWNGEGQIFFQRCRRTEDK